MSRPSMLVLPGGGYLLHAQQEAEPVAEWLESIGWRARVLRYPVGVRHPAPLHAVRDAVRAERAGGAEVVGVLGFSAGGHLAGHAALALRGVARPDLAVLGYPVVSMVTDPYEPARDRLLGPDAPRELLESVSLERLVDVTSPPMFLWHTANDPVVPAAQSRLLADALARAGVQHEHHVFPGAEHGSALAKRTRAAAWVGLAAQWLARFA